METFDSQGKIPPIGATDQGILSKKIADNDAQGKASRQPLRKKVAPPQHSEEPDEPASKEEHVIDIIV